MLYQRIFLIELNLYTLMSIVWIIPFETIRRKAFQKTVRDLHNEIFFLIKRVQQCFKRKEIQYFQQIH